ncbi:MAG: hypothetical protein IKR12_00040 [Clostridia bacterium]|nr:hypothetical protein [Clostridia bacterium]
MKTKTMTRIMGIVMAVVLFAVAPLFLTACGASANLTAVAKAAAKDYYKNHVDYDNFANTTYVYEEDRLMSNSVEMEYKVNAEDEEMTEGNFVFTDAHHITKKVQVVNAEEGKLALVIEAKDEGTNKYYSLNADKTLKEVTETNSEDIIYTFSYITEGEDTTYYLTKTYEEKADGEVVDSEKEYRAYASKAAYVSAVSEVLEYINDDLIGDGYFEFVTEAAILYVGSIIKTEVSGSNAKAKIEMETFFVRFHESAATVTDVTMYGEINFKNNKLGEVKSNMKMSGEGYTTDSAAKFHVEYAAEDVNTVIVLTDYTQNTSLSVDEDYLPEIEISLGD